MNKINCQPLLCYATAGCWDRLMVLGLFLFLSADLPNWQWSEILILCLLGLWLLLSLVVFGFSVGTVMIRNTVAVACKAIEWQQPKVSY